jgi:hypothetical protein
MVFAPGENGAYCTGHQAGMTCSRVYASRSLPLSFALPVLPKHNLHRGYPFVLRCRRGRGSKSRRAPPPSIVSARRGRPQASCFTTSVRTPRCVCLAPAAIACNLPSVAGRERGTVRRCKLPSMLSVLHGTQINDQMC